MGKNKKKRRNKFSSPLSDLVDKPNPKLSNVDYESSHIIPTIKSQKQDKSEIKKCISNVNIKYH